MTSALRIESPAKVNLLLRVLARETSGYHSLETVFCAISLCDVLHLEAAPGGIELAVDGDIDMGPVDANLITRAARLFYAETGFPPGIRIRVEKRIPSAAGLGGGSSNAAATLRALNTLHGEPLDRNRLLGCGAELGSDVPFFLGDSPYALAWSRGQRLLGLDPLPPRHVLVARPRLDMPTPAAFRRLAELRADHPDPGAACIPIGQLLDWAGIESLAANDFEAVAREWIPMFDDARDALRRNGARIALLAGSGSSLFGIFESPAGIADARAQLAALQLDTWVATTLIRWSGSDPQD